MHSSTVKKIVEKIAEDNEVSQDAVYDAVRQYYAKVISSMRDSKPIEAYFKTIKIPYLGTFLVSDYKQTRLYMRAATAMNKEKETETYNITLQGEKSELVETNEAFFFIADDEEMPKLFKGDRILVEYDVKNTTGSTEFTLLDFEILDAKHPFYKAAIDVPEGVRLVMDRKDINKIRI